MLHVGRQFSPADQEQSASIIAQYQYDTGYRLKFPASNSYCTTSSKTQGLLN